MGIFKALSGLFKKASDKQADQKKDFEGWKKGLAILWSGKEAAEFDYKDSQEQASRRQVDITAVSCDRRGKLYWRGFCHLRNEERTFAVDKVQSMVEHGGKKWNMANFLATVLKVDEEDVKQKALELREQARADISKRFSSLWKGRETVYFKLDEEDFDNKKGIEITLTEVLLSKEGYPYFLEEDLNIYACQEISSDIHYQGSYRQLYAFLLTDLDVDAKKIGISGLWNGKKQIQITAESGWINLKKAPATLASVVRDKLKTIFFVCYVEEGDKVYFLPWADVKSIYEDGKRFAPRDFMEKKLDLYLPKN